jgi:hypothetical protein
MLGWLLLTYLSYGAPFIFAMPVTRYIETPSAPSAPYARLLTL